MNVAKQSDVYRQDRPRLELQECCIVHGQRFTMMMKVSLIIERLTYTEEPPSTRSLQKAVLRATITANNLIRLWRTSNQTVRI